MMPRSLRMSCSELIFLTMSKTGRSPASGSFEAIPAPLLRSQPIELRLCQLLQQRIAAVPARFVQAALVEVPRVRHVALLLVPLAEDVAQGAPEARRPFQDFSHLLPAHPRRVGVALDDRPEWKEVLLGDQTRAVC